MIGQVTFDENILLITNEMDEDEVNENEEMPNLDGDDEEQIDGETRKENDEDDDMDDDDGSDE